MIWWLKLSFQWFWESTLQFSTPNSQEEPLQSKVNVERDLCSSICHVATTLCCVATCGNHSLSCILCILRRLCRIDWLLHAWCILEFNVCPCYTTGGSRCLCLLWSRSLWWERSRGAQTHPSPPLPLWGWGVLKPPTPPSLGLIGYRLPLLLSAILHRILY